MPHTDMPASPSTPKAADFYNEYRHALFVAALLVHYGLELVLQLLVLFADSHLSLHDNAQHVLALLLTDLIC